MDDLQAQPHDLEVEKAMLGSLLKDPDYLDEVATIIKGGECYREAHNVIYKAMLVLLRGNKEIDPVTVANYLNEKEQLESVGGGSYILGLFNSMPTAANVIHYAEKVKEYSDLRRLIKIGQNITGLGYKKDGQIREILNQAEEQLYDLSVGQEKQDVIFDLTDSKTMMDYIDHLEKMSKIDGFAGMTTGFIDLDKMFGGLERGGGYTIIAARPSMGKTALSINIGMNMARKEGAGAFFSAEMKKQKIMNRMIAKETGIDGMRIKDGNLKGNEWAKVTNAATKITEEVPLTIIDNKVKHINEIRSIAKKLKREKDIKFIIVDYLQLLEGFENKEGNLRIQALSRSLKGIGDSLDIHVIALAQLSRACEQRNNKRPVLSDLRDSGSIEQDADNVIFVYRDAYYDADSEKRGIMELLIRKARDGKVGTVEVGYQEQYQVVFNLSRRG